MSLRLRKDICRATSEQLRVSAACAISWRQLGFWHYTPPAKAQGGDRRMGNIEDHTTLTMLRLTIRKAPPV